MFRDVDGYTRETLPPNRADHIRTASHGAFDASFYADETLVATALGALHCFPVVRLLHLTRGYVSAGSQCRWQEARWSVHWYLSDGSIHGQSFVETDEAAARAYFARVTDAQTVSALRQADAQFADQRRATEAYCREQAASILVEAAKTYRSGWQYRANYPGLRHWCGFAKTKIAALELGRQAVEHAIMRNMPAA